MTYPIPPLQREAEHVVFLFELAHRRAKQLLAEGNNHPEDLFINASSVLDAYERLLDAPHQAEVTQR